MNTKSIRNIKSLEAIEQTNIDDYELWNYCNLFIRDDNTYSDKVRAMALIDKRQMGETQLIDMGQLIEFLMEIDDWDDNFDYTQCITRCDHCGDPIVLDAEKLTGECLGCGARYI